MGAKRTFKSKKKLTRIKSEYRAWKEWADGDTVVGTLVAVQEDQYGKPSWVLEVVEAFFQKKPKTAAKLKGKHLALNSAGKLDKALEQVEIGDTVQVVYTGTEEIERGKYKGKDSHQFEVDIVGDEDDEEFDEDEEDEDDDDVEL